MHSRAGLTELLVRSGIPEGSDEALRFLRYLALLEKWSARINLTASIDWEPLRPLFGEAIWAAAFYPADSGCHLDIGSGAGFPALLIRILRPRMRLTLVEPRGKRAAFLETAVHDLELADVTVYNGRLKEYIEKQRAQGSWDFISWKGLRLSMSDLSVLLEAAREATQFWIFHGAKLPLDDADRRFRLLRRETFPPKDSWFLSIFAKNVSRET